MIAVCILAAIFLLWFIYGKEKDNKAPSPIVWIILIIIVIIGVIVIAINGTYDPNYDMPIGK